MKIEDFNNKYMELVKERSDLSTEILYLKGIDNIENVWGSSKVSDILPKLNFTKIKRVWLRNQYLHGEMELKKEDVELLIELRGRKINDINKEIEGLEKEFKNENNSEV